METAKKGEGAVRGKEMLRTGGLSTCCVTKKKEVGKGQGERPEKRDLCRKTTKPGDVATGMCTLFSEDMYSEKRVGG